MTTNETPQPADSYRPRKNRKTPKLEVALADRDAYNPKEAAAMLGIAPRTLDTLRQRGDLRSINVGRRVLIPKSAIEEFLDGGVRKYGGRN